MGAWRPADPHRPRPRILVGNSGYRRSLKAPNAGFTIDGSPAGWEKGPQPLSCRRAEWLRTPGSTASSSCAPTPISIRSRRCYATASLERVEQLFRSAKVAAGDPAHLPRVRRHHPRPRVLLVPRPGPAQGTPGSTRRRWSGSGWPEILRDRSRSPPGGRGRAGRQALCPQYPDDRLRRQAVPDPRRRPAAPTSATAALWPSTPPAGQRHCQVQASAIASGSTAGRGRPAPTARPGGFRSRCRKQTPCRCPVRSSRPKPSRVSAARLDQCAAPIGTHQHSNTRSAQREDACRSIHLALSWSKRRPPKTSSSIKKVYTAVRSGTSQWTPCCL